MSEEAKAIHTFQRLEDVPNTKAPGKHQWTVFLIIEFGENDLADIKEDEQPRLYMNKGEFLGASPVGCFKCNQQYGEHEAICPGEPPKPDFISELESFIKDIG